MKRLLHIWAVYILTILFFAVPKTDVLAAPPENFQVQQMVTAGLNGPSGFEIAPDGRVFILERTGKIKVVKNGVLLAEPFADLPSVASGDRGLIGIAFDPDFGIANHYVYFYYTGTDLLNRLVRFDASGDVGTNGPFLLYQTNSPSQELHVGGSIQFGPDGKLYFAVGDNGYPPNAQNLGNPHGKILRINKDGSVPLDNPFYGQAGALPEIWAYGFRNPWRFQFDSQTGRMYGGDVGDFTWEEVNEIRKGQNYGWPVIEGPCTSLCGTTISPLYAYNHNGQSAAVTGGSIYNATMFPEEYQGAYFFGDYAVGFIKYITLDENGGSTGVHDFDLNAGSVVDIKVAGDGSMYYITYYPGRLYRISYTTGNQIPTANATADNLKGMNPHTVHFSSAGSSDPDEDPLTYLWDFGDGTTSTEANPTKTYLNIGVYTVELQVSDGTNTSNAVPLVVQVGSPPQLTVGSPQNGDTYKAGDVISYTAHAIDSAGFDMNDGDISTEIFLHHDTHFHPFLGPLIGRAGSFTIPDHGEASPNTWYEIKVTVTDQNGLTDTESVFIYPEKSTFILQTEPAGLQVFLDGVPVTTPRTIEGVINFKRELNVPTIQEINGVQYQFEGWSTNKPQKHVIATEPMPTTYIAHFRQAPAFNAEYFDNADLSGTPVITRQDQKIDFAWGDGSPDPLLNANLFSVRWSKNQYFAAGKYRFSAASDDGFRLYIDNTLVVDRWFNGVSSETHDIVLTAGEHAIRMEYRETGGGAYAKLVWDLTPDQPVVTEGFQAEYFTNTSLNGTPALTRTDGAINFDWGMTSPDPAIPVDNYSARWTKTEYFAGGVYEFTVKADDGVRLYIDDELFIDKWIDQAPTEYKKDKELLAGMHTVRMEYYENSGGAVATLSYQKKSDLPISGGYEAEYFGNKTLSGIPLVTRNDEVIAFDWAAGSPAPSVPVDNFSARWTKTENLAAGTYKFTVRADDGVRVYIDGELVINQWIDQPPTTYQVSKNLAAGAHEIIIEYFETAGGAVMQFGYELTDTPPPPAPEGYAAQFYNNVTLTGPAVVNRVDLTVNNEWGGGSPDALINPNNFSARWTKSEQFAGGTYSFTVTADDGVRVFIDNELILDKWIDQAPTTYTVEKALIAGNHTIVIEYYENTGGAVMKFAYTAVSGNPAPDEPYQTSFWNLPAPISAPAIPAVAPTLSREDETIDFTWDATAPAPQINPDGYVARWVKTHTLEAGTYEFTTTSDDGIRVFIDDEVVIDQWNDHASTIHKAQKSLTAGEHIVRVEYYENTGGAVAKFSFEKVTPNSDPEPEPIAGYTVDFFNNLTLTGTPVLSKLYPAINFILDGGTPDPLVNVDNFSARATKTKNYTAGTYTFTIQSDDGVRFWIDDQLIVDDWNDHALTTHTPSVTLTEGNHTLKLEYYERSGGAIFVFQEN